MEPKRSQEGLPTPCPPLRAAAPEAAVHVCMKGSLAGIHRVENLPPPDFPSVIVRRKWVHAKASPHLSSGSSELPSPLPLQDQKAEQATNSSC